MEIKVPKKPRVVIKEQQPDQRTVSVVPIRAISDRTLTAPQYRVLLAFCSYANKGGLTWVGIKTVGQKIGISTNRVAVLTRQLIAKGYIKVLYHGFAGERPIAAGLSQATCHLNGRNLAHICTLTAQATVTQRWRC